MNQQSNTLTKAEGNKNIHRIMSNLEKEVVIDKN